MAHMAAAGAGDRGFMPKGNLSDGLPPSKQQQHEEALAPLDDQERRAVQKRLMRRNHGQGASNTTRSTARDRYNDPSFVSPSQRGRRSARGVYTARSAMTTSRSMMTTARSSSPTGRYHPDPTRRLELRKVRRDARGAAHPLATASARARAAPPRRLRSAPRSSRPCAPGRTARARGGIGRARRGERAGRGRAGALATAAFGVPASAPFALPPPRAPRARQQAGGRLCMCAPTRAFAVVSERAPPEAH